MDLDDELLQDANEEEKGNRLVSIEAIALIGFAAVVLGVAWYARGIIFY